LSGIRDQNIHRSANIAGLILNARVISATGQTDVGILAFTPGHRFQLTRVRSWCSAVAATITYDVLAGARVAVNDAAFTAATEVAGTLSTTPSNTRGSASEAITVRYTSNGTGSVTNGAVTVVYKPWPLNGQLGPST
jgi:hypothetical protein